jgi:hypothetical protein
MMLAHVRINVLLTSKLMAMDYFRSKAADGVEWRVSGIP